MQENLRKITAVPRVHEEFSAQCPAEISDSAEIFVLDPTQQSGKSYAVQPPFVWNAAYARQFLADLQASTGELAKDSKNTVLDMLSYQYSPAQQMDSAEQAALARFAGKSIVKSARDEAWELGQRMLLIAYHNENLYLELGRVNEKFSVQQAKLKTLLDENEHVAQASYGADDMLIHWKQLLPAFVLFCQDADAFWVTDKTMADDIASLGAFMGQKGACRQYVLTKEQIREYLPNSFKPFCDKEQYLFLLEYAADKGETEK